MCRSFAVLPFLILACWSGAAEPRTGEPLGIVFLGADRPYLMILDVDIGQKSYQETWRQHIQRTLAFLDRNQDGVLDQVEWKQAPSQEQMNQHGIGVLAVEPDAAPPFADVDVKPSDGKVTLAEFEDYYRHSAAGPLQLEAGHLPGDVDRLSVAMAHHLDADGDGKLSRADVQAASQLLRKLDLNDDDVLSITEIWTDLNVRIGQGYTISPAEPETLKRFIPILGDISWQRVLDRYDSDKDGRLSRMESGLPAELFNRLDSTADQHLLVSELARWPSTNIEPAIKLKAGSADPVRRQCVDVLVDLYHEKLPEQKRALQPLQRSFELVDANNDGLLNVTEIQQPPFELVGLLRLADRNGDGKLARAELADYTDLQHKAASSTTTLLVADRGRSLYEMIDSDRNGRIGMRELRQAWSQLEPWDANRDGVLDKEEIPHQYHVVLSQGRMRSARSIDFPGYVSAVRPIAKGPLWFRKMDRNGDVEVNQREFFGNEDAFRRVDTDADGNISLEEAEAADRIMRRK